MLSLSLQGVYFSVRSFVPSALWEKTILKASYNWLVFCFCAWISSFFLSKVLRISRSPFLPLSTRTCLGRLVCLFREGESRIILMCMENATFLWCSVLQHHSPQSSNQYWWRQSSWQPLEQGAGEEKIYVLLRVCRQAWCQWSVMHFKKKRPLLLHSCCRPRGWRAFQIVKMLR